MILSLTAFSAVLSRVECETAPKSRINAPVAETATHALSAPLAETADHPVPVHSRCCHQKQVRHDSRHDEPGAGGERENGSNCDWQGKGSVPLLRNVYPGLGSTVVV
jgi:hypothetical protein